MRKVFSPGRSSRREPVNGRTDKGDEGAGEPALAETTASQATVQGRAGLGHGWDVLGVPGQDGQGQGGRGER